MNQPPVKALSIRQPWANAIMAGIKTVENRVWYTRHRGTIAVHASEKIDRLAFGRAGDLDLGALIEAERSTSRILGTVELVNVHADGDPHCHLSGCFASPWSEHSTDIFRPIWHWEFINPRRLVTPIRCKGALQLWTPNESTQYLIETGEFEND